MTQQVGHAGAEESAREAASASGVVHTGEARLQLRDFAIPLLCVAALVAHFSYLSGADLDPLEQASVNASNLWTRTLEHIQISLTVTVIVLAFAIGLGVLVTRPRLRWMLPGTLAVANIGQAVPNIGLIAIIGLAWTVGFWPVVIALVVFAVLPVLRNTIVGIEQVDAGVIDAARGMGMSNGDILRRVELVLAIPVIAAGARTALVLAVATVPFGDYLGAGGLGDLIFSGIKLNRPVVLFTGALIVAILALLLDWLGSVAERLVTPRGIR